MCWLAGCATYSVDKAQIGKEPFVTGSTTSTLLAQIPTLDQQKITIAVYSFPDLTGQRKPNTKFSQLSTAVPQGSEVRYWGWAPPVLPLQLEVRRDARRGRRARAALGRWLRGRRA